MRLGAYPASCATEPWRARSTAKRRSASGTATATRSTKVPPAPGGRRPASSPALSPDGKLVEMVELPDHPWFVGCQFHPEFKSKPTDPHPLFAAFIAAALEEHRAGRPGARREREAMPAAGEADVTVDPIELAPGVVLGAQLAAGHRRPVRHRERRARRSTVARFVAEIARGSGSRLVFKASFDKANRTSVAQLPRPRARRGPARAGRRCGEETGLPVLTDVHEPEQATPVAEVVDVLQIPAFLCRQTDLLRRRGRDRPAGQRQEGPVPGARGHGARGREGRARPATSGSCVTERGTSFGYNNLVVDMRALRHDARATASRSSSTPPTPCSCRAAASRPAGARQFADRWRAPRSRPGPTASSSRCTRSPTRRSPTAPPSSTPSGPSAADRRAARHSRVPSP